MTILDKVLPWRRLAKKRNDELNLRLYDARERRRFFTLIRAAALTDARKVKTEKQDREHRLDAPVCGNCDHYMVYEWGEVCLVTPIGGIRWADGSRERATLSNARSVIAPCGPTGKLYTPFVEPDVSKEMAEYDAQRPDWLEKESPDAKV